MRLIEPIQSAATDEELITALRSIKEEAPRDPELAAALAQRLADSGTIVAGDSGEIWRTDVASTGGPSSLTTLLCPLYLHAAGATVPKLGIPGRPAGGIDCLEQIQGYSILLDGHVINSILRATRYVHFIGGDTVAPLDSRIFKLRQKHGMQEVPSLAAASLLSKKLSVGLKSTGLDIRVSQAGNFGRTWDEARSNASMFRLAAGLLGISATTVLTDGRFPYQPYIGRGEALVALEAIFRDSVSPWLRQHQDLCRSISIACSPLAKRADVASVKTEDLATSFYANVVAQGGTREAFAEAAARTRNGHSIELHARESGFASYDLRGIRDVLVSEQRDTTNEKQLFADPAGVILLARPGDWVEKGQLIATVRTAANNSRMADALAVYICQTSSSPMTSLCEAFS